jgi:chromosome segregation ATPase
MTWELDISNIAGIRNGAATLHPGTNAVQASNWQGKTSLVTALRTVLGGEILSTTLTDGESEGSVHLQTPDDEYQVTLNQSAGTVSRSGTPYLTDEQDQICAELFAFLDEDNAIRTAVRDGADLTPHLIRPLEQENISEQIQSLQEQRRAAESDLEDAERAAEKLTAKTEEITSLESKLEELQEELAEIDGDESDSGDQEALEDDLADARRQRERAQQRVSRLEAKLESLESQIEDKETALDAIDVPAAPDLKAQLKDKQQSVRELSGEIETLETLYNTNERVLEEGHLDLVADVDRQIDTDQLSCWVCGHETTRDDIQVQIDALSDAIAKRREQRSTLKTEVSELKERQNEIRQQRREKQSLEEDLSSLRSTLSESQDELEEARSDLEEVMDRVDELESQVEETDDRRSTLEQEIARTEATLEQRRTVKSELEDEAAQRDDLQAQIDELSQEIQSLRARREHVIATAREAFDDALEDVVEKFDPSFESARLEKHVDPDTGETSDLELIIARDGREITVDAMSEGEVELVGFIAALAGYEAFSVADRVPCMLLDDVGGLASEHLQTLVDYLSDRTEYVVTTAYPEAGDFGGTLLSPDDWDVVSDQASAPV